MIAISSTVAIRPLIGMKTPSDGKTYQTPMKKKRRDTQPEWYWVEGLTKIGGVKVWDKLYCHRSPLQCDTTIRMIRHQLDNPPTKTSSGDKAAEQHRQEIRMLGRYRDFRVTDSNMPEVRCPECSSNYFKKVKVATKTGNPVRFFKCRNCGHRWERTREGFTGSVNGKTAKPLNTGDTPQKPSKASKQGKKGNHASERPAKRQKRIQRPVSKDKKRAKII